MLASFEKTVDILFDGAAHRFVGNLFSGFRAKSRPFFKFTPTAVDAMMCVA